MKQINTLEEFAEWVIGNNVTAILRRSLRGMFDMWMLSEPIKVANENALDDLWEECILIEFPGYEFNCDKAECLKWCDEQFGITITMR